MYDAGGNGPHSGARNSSFGLATLGPDRFAGVTSMESHSSMGTSVSSSVLVTGNSMMATFDIVEPDGSVTVAILAGKAKYTSKPISCGSQECTDTSLEFPELPSGLSSLAGKLVQLELTVVKAVVYTLGFK